MNAIGRFRSMRNLLLATVLLAALPACASAAWLGYKNETNAAFVVQTSVVVNGKVMRGKAHTLYPGEIAWDNIAAPGARQVAVYDPKANNRLVFQDNVNVLNQDIFLAVRLEQPPAAAGKAAPPAQIKLVPTKPPVPAGTVPAKPAPPPAPNTPAPVKPTPPATPAPSTPPPATPAPPPPGTVPVRPPTAPTPPAGKSGS